MNKPISFELAKLLKEKRFDRPCCEFYYMKNNPNKLQESFNKNKKWDFNFENEYQFPCKSISAPTIAEVLMWLYEKHGIWIEVYYDNGKKEFYTVLNGEEYKYNLPTEAYKAAIDYCLTNLI